jgi:hypothetical protein
MQRRPEREVSKVPVIGVESLHDGLEPKIGLLNRGVEDRQTSGTHDGFLRRPA